MGWEEEIAAVHSDKYRNTKAAALLVLVENHMRLCNHKRQCAERMLAEEADVVVDMIASNNGDEELARGRLLATRSAFTLVEMMMVIAIIGLLISLLLPAVNAARNRAVEAVMQSDIEQMALGLEACKNLYGAYPPDRNWGLPTADPPDGELATALRRAFPRAAWTRQDVMILQTLDQAEMLVFWLGGIYDGVKPTGFSADPRNPFAGPDAAHDPFNRGVVGQRIAPLVGFDQTRLADTDGDGFPEYYPGHARADQAPYVFFSPRPTGSYLDTSGAVPFYRHAQAGGLAVPYQVASGRFVAEGRYQIIAAGIDNDFGVDDRLTDPANRNKLEPTGAGYGPGDADNITSFTKGRLGDAR